MALTNKGEAWERKNSLYVIFSFIPILNCIPFFHMHSRIKNRKWALLGWFSIIIQILLIVAFVIVPTIPNAVDEPNYFDVAGYSPSAVDFMNKEQKAKYYEDSSYEFSTEFKLSDEYENFQEAIEQYQSNQREWEQQPEIQAQISEYENYASIRGGIITSLPIALIIVYIFLIIIVFAERPKYLKLLAQSENKDSITDRIKSVKNNIDENQNIKMAKAQAENTTKTDINSADEDALSALKGITIVDAKKVVAYREEHGGFSNADEFFTVINAKPHIVAALESKITVGDYKTEKTNKPENSSKRQLDL